MAQLYSNQSCLIIGVIFSFLPTCNFVSSLFSSCLELSAFFSSHLTSSHALNPGMHTCTLEHTLYFTKTYRDLHFFTPVTRQISAGHKSADTRQWSAVTKEQPTLARRSKRAP